MDKVEAAKKKMEEDMLQEFERQKLHELEKQIQMEVWLIMVGVCVWIYL